MFCNIRPLGKVWGQFPATGLWFDTGNGTYSDIKIYNNVFDTYGDAVRFKVGNEDNRPRGYLDGVSIKNNAVLGMTNAIWETEGTEEIGRIKNATLRYNLKDNDAVWLKNSTAIAHSHNLQGDPGYSCRGNRWDSYYRPSSKSSYCVDKGTEVGLPYSGLAPDIGCYEYAPSHPK
jgi:hypothetical protein